jgi:hypothetical protein
MQASIARSAPYRQGLGRCNQFLMLFCLHKMGTAPSAVSLMRNADHRTYPQGAGGVLQKV